MPCLKNVESEARRIAAVKAALHRDQRWLRGAFYGNVSPAGLRRRGQNSTRAGADSLVFKLALRYCDAVILALPVV